MPIFAKRVFVVRAPVLMMSESVLNRFMNLCHSSHQIYGLALYKWEIVF